MGRPNRETMSRPLAWFLILPGIAMVLFAFASTRTGSATPALAILFVSNSLLVGGATSAACYAQAERLYPYGLHVITYITGEMFQFLPFLGPNPIAFRQMVLPVIRLSLVVTATTTILEARPVARRPRNETTLDAHPKPSVLSIKEELEHQGDIVRIHLQK